ncbi:cyclopropane-fatty-acyl-phospholipid synthase family protein [Kutzneria buriramensis]|uniref:Cyclopropane-fatty-acyl-phospholipid synthase n=1 Tax=Kutzneria buriramensis TaxID=1045776 RepID=A0A3E0H1Y1_9PSEU|nr:cyclopropane-fatty-acyl-phospholipid synthase family protein [Kutzneria buriramensis]REH36274.1 cyclopropane-fatty-acyl-phospholipid synthase [Kutzneria buriramensis]
MSVAQTLAALVRRFLGVDLPVGLRAWDGSVAGPAGAPMVVIRSRRALRRLLWDPNELGLARAFVAGDIDVEGDLKEGLARFWGLARRENLGKVKLTAADRLHAVGQALKLGVIGPRPEPPPEEARLSGAEHTKSRDRDAIAHHYDLSNDFYRTLLDPNMAYSCGYWTSDAPDYTVEDAQRDKLDLICRKLDLKPGMRLLDVGCGWGSLILHAATHYGVHATGVTLAAQQRQFIEQRIAERGLTELVEVRLQDYREIPDAGFDAIGTVEMGEHVGLGNYPTYAAQLFRLLKPEGRLLLQQMSRVATAPKASGGGAFIERYVAPDMHMRPVGETIAMLERAGLEVRDVQAMREHYVWTVDAWARTLEESAAELTALVGEGQLRVWRLYLAGGSLAFQENRMGVDQILAVRPTVSGASGMPRTREVPA